MIEVDFKHFKSNFSAQARSVTRKSKYFRTITCGNLIGYKKLSSKKQKVKHSSDQLALTLAIRVNRFFHISRRSRILRLDYQLDYLSKSIGLIPSFLKVLTSNSLRNRYKKRVREVEGREFRYPSLQTLYSLSCKPYQNSSYHTRRMYRIRRNEHKDVTSRKRFRDFNDNLSKKIFYMFVHRESITDRW